MLKQNGYAQYQNSKILTASPAELTLMLYDGAIKFGNIAIIAIENNDPAKAHENIVKVEKIVQNFRDTLDKKYPVWQDFDNVYVTNNNVCGIYIPKNRIQEFDFLIYERKYQKNAPLYTYNVHLETGVKEV